MKRSPRRRKKVALITGGAGFIGSHAADALARQGFRIRILDNLSPPVHTGKWPAHVLRKGYELVRGDVRKRTDWMNALRNVDYVLHMAAYQDQLPDFSNYVEVNTMSTALLFELIVAEKLPIKKIVLASTQFVYGDGAYRCSHKKAEVFYPEVRQPSQFKKRQWDIACPHGKPAAFTPFKEEQPLNPPNAYALSKAAAEDIALRLGRAYGIPTVVLRYSIVQGSRQSPYNMYSGSLRIFAAQALAADPITVYEDGNQRRDFVNVEDAVRGTLLVLGKKAADFQIFNVGGGRGWNVMDFAKLVKRVSKSESPIVLTGEFRRTDTRHAVSDIAKLKKLGWRPKAALEKSIQDYAEWFGKQKFDKNRIRAAQLKLRKAGVLDRAH